MGLDKISVFILRVQLVSPGRATAFGISKFRTWGSGIHENVWISDLQIPGHESGHREGSALLPGFTEQTLPNPDWARVLAPFFATHLAGTCFVILPVKFMISKP